MSRLFRWTLLALMIVGLPSMLYFTASNFLVSGVAASLGLLFAVLYVALVLILLRLSPMWPRAGVLWVAACLVWGGGASFLLVMVSGLPLMTLMDKLGWETVAMSFGGAWPEEISKALGVAVILLSFRQLNRPWHGLVTGAVVGLGFETVENHLYGSIGAMLDPNSDLSGTLSIWLARILMGPALHIVFTALAGWGLGLAIFTARRSVSWRFGVGLAWLTVAFALHFAWNLMFEDNFWLIAHYVIVAVVMYPLFIVVWLRAHRACRADRTYAFTPRPVTSVAQLPGGVVTPAGLEPGGKAGSPQLSGTRRLERETVRPGGRLPDRLDGQREQGHAPEGQDYTAPDDHGRRIE